MATYADRLTAIQAALDSYKDDEAATNLLSEAEAMAHNLAGTASMFGYGPLGDLAAELIATLRQDPQLDVDHLKPRINGLVTALRLAA